ncbi:hypothetical protein JT358_01165 [Micrococcales bacterium 31B]|nr:hypothetical protein [Micrococcales bacterium 31B]
MSNRDDEADGGHKGASAPGPRRPVVSSLTGRPMELDADDPRGPRTKPASGGGNDARLLRDVPPHWGRQ